MTNRERQERDAAMIAGLATILMLMCGVMGVILWSVGQCL